MMNIGISKIRLLSILAISSGMLAGCIGEAPESAATGTQTLTTEIQMSGLGVDIAGLSATLEIAGMGTYPMTVNADNTVSVTVEGISPGFRTFSVTYYANGVVLAAASKIAYAASGQNISILVTPQEMDRNFDDDFDGWVNLAEVIWGSEPLLASSTPPSDDPRYVMNASGGETVSASYTLQDSVGEAVETGSSTSWNYALSGGFQAYH